MSPILIIGATRGLGGALTKLYAERPDSTVYGTTRSATAPDGFPDSVKWLPEVDLTQPSVGSHLVRLLGGSQPLGAVIITAGYFSTEDLTAEKGPNWEQELRMYTTSSVAPVFIVHALANAGLLQAGSKVVLVSSESGSIGLRHEKEGGGNYAHHASKSALNMVGKLLSLDLKEKEVVVSIVHPGFMRTEMTKGVGFDKYWDDGGAVTPEEAAKSLADWTDNVDISKTGQYWAPRGPGDIGTADVVLGADLPTPLQLPW
ncbi:oxidoreductase [Plectosphaerella plurivora]|uniref:Oxidoreductase n=1 Tax=Plectosphaerella plurivora TaxID=936078 RepID=A0A9P8VGB2_9PEZI|nr:oxidoreductase [Plectosphaerella plurivora]